MHVHNTKLLLQKKGEWSVILTIDSVQKSDTEKEYVLEARNNEGMYEYHIVLSTSSEPAGKLFEKSDSRKFPSFHDVTLLHLEIRVLYISKISEHFECYDKCY